MWRSAAYVRGWKAGYARAARTAGRQPRHLLLTWLVQLLTTWTLCLLLLWAAFDIFLRNVAGGEVPRKVILSKVAAWNRIHRPTPVPAFAPQPPAASRVEPPALSRGEAPAVSRVERPALSRAEAKGAFTP